MSATDNIFARSNVAVSYGADGAVNDHVMHEWIESNAPFPLREILVIFAADLKPVSDAVTADEDSIQRGETAVTVEGGRLLHSPEQHEALDRGVADRKILAAYETPAHLDPGMRFSVWSPIENSEDDVRAAVLKIGVSEGGNFYPLATEILTAGQKANPGPNIALADWPRILEDGHAWETVATQMIHDFRSPGGEPPRRTAGVMGAVTERLARLRRPGRHKK